MPGFHSLQCLAPVADETAAGSTTATGSDRSGGSDLETGAAVAGYQLPVQEIRQIVDAPPTPGLSLSPNRQEVLFLQRRSLPPLSQLAQPELKLAGIRIDPQYNTCSRMSYYTSITIHTLLQEGILGQERRISGPPEGSKINYVSWSPDDRHVAFTIREADKVKHTEL
jgi:hypothetical protein